MVTTTSTLDAGFGGGYYYGGYYYEDTTTTTTEAPTTFVTTLATTTFALDGGAEPTYYYAATEEVEEEVEVIESSAAVAMSEDAIEVLKADEEKAMAAFADGLTAELGAPVTVTGLGFPEQRRLTGRGLQDAGVTIDFFLKKTEEAADAAADAISSMAEGGGVGGAADSLASSLSSSLQEEFGEEVGEGVSGVAVEPPVVATIVQIVIIPIAGAGLLDEKPPEAGASSEAAADMLAALQDKIPVKNVQDDTVFTVTDVSMYREVKYQFYPSNRHKKAEDGAVQSQQGSLLENYPSPAMLDLDVAMFILPLRTALKDLCSFKQKKTPESNNFISEAHQYWRAVPERDAIITTCGDFEAFNRTTNCKDANVLRSRFPDRYRAACSVDLAPAFVGHFNVSVPLNLKFAIDKKPKDKQDPEWYLDTQTMFSFGFEQALLDVEQRYMQGSSSVEQLTGKMLWAGETYIRGKANCDPNFPECEQNMPANPPVFLPRLALEVDIPRTLAVFNDLGHKPKYWPENDTLMTELMEQKFAVGLSEAIRTAMSAEDASLTLKPRMRYIVTVTVRIDPVYRMLSRYGSNMELNRWNFFVTAVSVQQMEMDYSRRSKCAVRMVFNIADSSTRQKEKYKYDINDFMTSVGAWTGIWAIGLGLLNKWQKRTMPFGFQTEDDIMTYLGPKYEKLDIDLMKKIDNRFKHLQPCLNLCCGLRRKTARVAPA